MLQLTVIYHKLDHNSSFPHQVLLKKFMVGGGVELEREKVGGRGWVLSEREEL